MSSQQAQDEMTQRLAILYEQIVLYGEFVIEGGGIGFTEDELSLIRWAFGITKQ